MAKQEARSKRDAAATKSAILDSAREAFARAGYDGVGVREIAAGAGVTAMLINRYFGSKQQLFLEVVAQAMVRPKVMVDKNINSPQAAHDIATALVQQTTPQEPPLDGFLILLHAASNPLAAQVGRSQIEAHHHRLLTESLQGDLAPERAALVLSMLIGFQLMRQMFELEALADTDPGTLVELLTPVLQQLISGAQPSEDTAP